MFIDISNAEIWHKDENFKPNSFASTFININNIIELTENKGNLHIISVNSEYAYCIKNTTAKEFIENINKQLHDQKFDVTMDQILK